MKTHTSPNPQKVMQGSRYFLREWRRGIPWTTLERALVHYTKKSHGPWWGVPLDSDLVNPVRFERKQPQQDCALGRGVAPHGLWQHTGDNGVGHQGSGGVWLTLPNGLSGLRLLSAPFLVVLIHQGLWTWAFWGILLASLTDWMDGFLARRLHHESPVGAWLDPLADKMLLMTLFISSLYISTRLRFIY